MYENHHYPRNYGSRVVSLETAGQLIKEGYHALDTHCHSSYSFDVPDVKETSPESIYKVQKSLGLMNVLTDHDTLNGYNHLKHKGYKTIPAVELTFRPKIARKIITERSMHTLHINIFGLSNHDMIMISEIAHRGDLDELVAYMKSNDLDWTYNHPFYHDKNEYLNWRIIPSLAKNYFDVIELNSQFSRGLNNINQRIAEKLGKGIVASSDSHTGNPGSGFVIAEGKNFKDFWENVKNGDAYVMRRNIGTWDVVREASMTINQAFNANIRPRREKRYTPATGFGPFDSIAKSVTSGRLRNRFVLKKVIQMFLQSLKYTAGPMLAWKLHVTKDEERAEHVRRRIHLITNKLKELENNIKNRKHSNKHRSVIHVRPKYYGEELVKSNSARKI